MTTDPLTEALDQLEIAGQELEAAALAIEELRELDRKAAAARIRPHIDLLVARVEENVLFTAARAIKARRTDVVASEYDRAIHDALADIRDVRLGRAR